MKCAIEIDIEDIDFTNLVAIENREKFSRSELIDLESYFEDNNILYVDDIEWEFSHNMEELCNYVGYDDVQELDVERCYEDYCNLECDRMKEERYGMY